MFISQWTKRRLSVINKSDKPQHNPPERNIDNKAEDKKEADKPDVIGFKDGGPKYVSAPTGQATAFDGRLFFDAGRHADFRYKSTSVDYKERFAISAWIYPESEQGGAIVTKMQDKSEERDNNLPRIGGWGLFFNNGKVHFNMVREWNYDGFRAETETTLPLKMWHHVLLVFDGLGQADDRVRIYVNGQPQQLKINQRNFYLYWGLPEVPLRIGGGGGAEMRFKGALDELRIYTRLPELDEIEILACADPLERIATIPAQKRTPGQKLKLLHAFLEWGAPDDARELWKKTRRTEGEKERT
ncbi:MAG: LamG domain-containing protein [Pyrinomonadaceae bacterium]